jgi:hypothetical protein
MTWIFLPGVAVLRHIEADGGGDLHAGRLLLAGHRQQRADLDVALRLRGGGGETERSRGASCQYPLKHVS